MLETGYTVPGEKGLRLQVFGHRQYILYSGLQGDGGILSHKIDTLLPVILTL